MAQILLWIVNQVCEFALKGIAFKNLPVSLGNLWIYLIILFLRELCHDRWPRP